MLKHQRVNKLECTMLNLLSYFIIHAIFSPIINGLKKQTLSSRGGQTGHGLASGGRSKWFGVGLIFLNLKQNEMGRDESILIVERGES